MTHNNHQARHYYTEFRTQACGPVFSGETMSATFLEAAELRRAHIPEASAPLTLGGMDVDDHGINRGLLRCPRCDSRLVSKCGALKERQGPEALLWVPRKPDSAPAGSAAEDATGSTEEETWEWSEHPHTWWWLIEDMNDVDNGGLSRVVTSPAGPLKLVMCCECNYGPIGYQWADEAHIWLCCALLYQQALLHAPVVWRLLAA